MRVEQIANNQFKIITENGVYFQSYDSVVAFRDNNGKVTLGEDWRYSRTTMKYLCQFLNRDSIREIDRLVTDGKITIDENLGLKG